MKIFRVVPALLLLCSTAFADSVAVSVSLNPVGSFVANSDALKMVGASKRIGNDFAIKEIQLPLDSLKTGIALRDQHMKTKYFETQKFPNAVLSKVLGRNGSFTGDLTLRGKTKHVTGTYRFNGNALQADFTCAMADFAIGRVSYMGVGAEDEVAVKATLNLPPIAVSAR